MEMWTKKTIYLIRHGESVWNKAQKDKDAVAMLSAKDHPLNKAGKEQAEGLQVAASLAVSLHRIEHSNPHHTLNPNSTERTPSLILTPTPSRTPTPPQVNLTPTP